MRLASPGEPSPLHLDLGQAIGHSIELGNDMNQDWLEMAGLRTRRLEAMTWIPLRSSRVIARTGESGAVGFKEEFFGVGTVAVPVTHRDAALRLGWMDVGISRHHRPHIHENTYIPADTFAPSSGALTGLHLVLEQNSIFGEVNEWYLHQDLVLGLGLKREGDVWVRPEEGYIDVVRLQRRSDEPSPCHIEIRIEHLKDFLCARAMGLCSTSYRSRRVIVDNASGFRMLEGNAGDGQRDRWSVRVSEIHEGGMPFGANRAVFHMHRTDAHPDEDVPDLSAAPGDKNVDMQSWTVADRGKLLFSIHGELWRTEWIEPADASPRVREDEVPPRVFFVTSTSGHQESSETLADAGKWLWFRPDVVRALIDRRGGGLQWYTRDTGGVWSSPGDTIHFGVNSVGLVNSYAKDVAMLSEWQQRIWAGYNVAPDAEVSKELRLAQVDAEPAETRAPEDLLPHALDQLGELLQDKLGVAVLGKHPSLREVLGRCHRFRAVDSAGLFALAKDLARVTADNIDTTALHRFLKLSKGEKLGSLKSLERVLGQRMDGQNARDMLTSLVGIYELRLADAHLPSTDVADAFALAGVDQAVPFVHQGLQLLESCVESIQRISSALETWRATF